MGLTPGTRLGPYEIVAPLGAGGMGEVYRARDTKLGRDVALKLLPDPFADDRERLARFQREAQILASLNHPNIGAIYGLEEGGVGQARAGSTPRWCWSWSRARRSPIGSRKGPIPIDEALPIARADRGGARSRARARRHPPRPEAREYQAAAGRDGQGSRLRSRESDGFRGR